MKPLVAISLGCPCGIGPEVSLAAAARQRDALCLLVGDAAIVRRAARLIGVAEKRLVEVGDAREARRALTSRAGVIAHFSPARSNQTMSPLTAKEAPYGQPTRAAGRAQLLWIDAALDLVRGKVADALVTGPVSKHAIASSAPRASEAAPSSRAGAAARKFRGHTEHLAERLGAREVVMAFWSEELVTSLVTTHLALADVSAALRPAGVAMATFWLTKLVAGLGARRPRIAVCGVNPHAGEHGLLGREEMTRIEPGIVLARRRLARAGVIANIEGPIGAETAMRLARAGNYDGVVAMYHDQATIPMKLIGFGEAVNVTLGLPIIRTSVDHGTGYDIAGRGKADARGMKRAIELAARLTRGRRGRVG